MNTFNYIVLAIISLLSVNANSMSYERLDQLKIKIISFSKDLQSLDRQLCQIEKLEKFWEGCRVELKKEAFPLSCYIYIDIKASLKLEDGKREAQISAIDDHCARQEFSINDLPQVQTLAKSPYLTEFCMRNLHKKLKILHYQAKKEAPELLF